VASLIFNVHLSCTNNTADVESRLSIRMLYYLHTTTPTCVCVFVGSCTHINYPEYSKRLYANANFWYEILLHGFVSHRLLYAKHKQLIRVYTVGPFAGRSGEQSGAGSGVLQCVRR
jgi:hypothetical protein